MSSVSAAMPARKGILGTPLSLRQSNDKLSAVTSSRDFEKPRSQGEEKNPVPFVQEDGFSDIVLVVEGKRLYTSRSLLCMSSPVLARMLASPEQKDQREFPLQGKSYDTIHELLYILHPAYQRKVTGKRWTFYRSQVEETQNLEKWFHIETVLHCFCNNRLHLIVPIDFKMDIKVKKKKTKVLCRENF